MRPLVHRAFAIATAASLVFVFACSTDTFGDSDGSADGAACPDESGEYAISLKGSGCPSFSGSLGRVCITQTTCSITAMSASGAFNATVKISMTGGFSGAAIDEGPLMRTGCDGAWAPTTDILTVTCGGDGDSGQSCIATLTRTGPPC